MRNERVEAASLARLIGDWTATPGDGSRPSLPGQLSSAITYLVEANLLADGVILPAQRVLAKALGIARSTVSEAYELLGAEGVVESRQGSGSRVRRRGMHGGAMATDGRMASLSARFKNSIDLSSGALAGLPIVADTIAALDRNEIAELVAVDGYFPAGIVGLREAVAQDYSRMGLATNPEQILITSGAQQAIWLLAHLLVGPGDEVVVEDPCYRGAVEAFRSCGVRMSVVPMREDGIDLAHLDRLAAKGHFRVLYAQPTAQNPTGITMSDAVRAELGDIVHRHNIFLIEDRCSADLTLNDAIPRAGVVTTPDPRQSAIVGTASKVLWGGLRVGWIRAEPAMIAHLLELRKTIDLAGSPLDQLVAAKLLRRPHQARQARVASLRESLRVAEETLGEIRPNWRWRHPDGGSGLWVDTGEDAVALSERGRKRGVLIVPGPVFSAVEGHRSYLRLPLGHAASTYRDALLHLGPD